MLNRRFCAALFVLLFACFLAALPLWRAQSESQAQDTGGGSAGEQQGAIDPPLPAQLPPLPGDQNANEQNAGAQPPTPRPWGSSSQTAAAAETAVDKDRAVLLHRNGRVFRGKIADQGDVYVVTLPFGEINLNKNDVEFVGANVSECYAFRRTKVEPGNVERHLELAGWCATEKLIPEALQELEMVKSLAPQHPRIPLVARQIDLAQREPQTDSIAATGPGVAKSYARNEVLARNLPDGAVAAFTEQVQPLLMNSCATAGCHVQGSQESAFQIQRYSPSQGAKKRLTQQNIRAVLRYIDPDAAEKSPLLIKAVSEHGGGTRPPLAASDSAQFEAMARWVLQVIGDKGASSAQPVNSTPAAGQPPARLPVNSNAQPLRSQQPVIRTADEIRALLTGHSFVESYDKLHPQNDEAINSIIPVKGNADSAAANPQGMNQNGITQASADMPGSGQNVGDDPLGQQGTEANLSADERSLLDMVNDTPPNRIRVGAGDQLRQGDLHEAELHRFEARDPFDPAIFNRQFGTRPPSRAMSGGPGTPSDSMMQGGPMTPDGSVQREMPAPRGNPWQSSPNQPGNLGGAQNREGVNHGPAENIPPRSTGAGGN